MMTGTAAATLPTSSSTCMIFLIRAYITQFPSAINVSHIQYDVYNTVDKHSTVSVKFQLSLSNITP